MNLTPDYLNDVLGLRDTWLAFVCLLGIILAIILLILLALRQRIQIAIEVYTFLQYKKMILITYVNNIILNCQFFFCIPS